MESMPIQALLFVIGGLGLALAGFGVMRQRKAAVSIDDRLATFGERPLSLAEQEMKLPFSERVMRPLVKKWSYALGGRTSEKSVSKMKIKLAQAGNPSGFGPAEF